jgi:hypothetical protein
MKPFILNLMDLYFKRHRNNDWNTNEWLYGQEMEVYVRKGKHYLNKNMYTCLDIANIKVYNPGAGVFTLFLMYMEKMNPWDAIFIENVHNERFQKFFIRRDYTEIPDPPPPCFYKLK